MGLFSPETIGLIWWFFLWILRKKYIVCVLVGFLVLSFMFV